MDFLFIEFIFRRLRPIRITDRYNTKRNDIFGNIRIFPYRAYAVFIRISGSPDRTQSERFCC